MNYRLLGKTNYNISEMSIGTWQVGGRWGEAFDEKNAIEILNSAMDMGVNFIDTADVYNNGLSEKIIGKVIKSRSERIYVATKCGRRLNPHIGSGYNKKNITAFVEDSLQNMNLETLDLIQLHCPPSEVFEKDEVFTALSDLKAQGKILHYGVSVEKVDEAIKAIQYPGVSTVQIIFNMFRQKPCEKFFQEASKRNVGIIVRVPLASGLLTGKIDRDTVFNENDHRSNNRNGEHFDKGETFSGVDFNKGLLAVEKLKELFPKSESLANYALKWILMQKEVSCVIPGASRPSQSEANIKAADLSPLTDIQMTKIKEIYDTYIKPDIHNLW